MPSYITAPINFTVSDILIRVKRTFGDESGTQIDNDDIMRWANDGQLDIARKTQCLIKTETYNTAASDYDYPIPAGFLFFLQATFNGRLLSPIPTQELDSRYPNRLENYPVGIPEYISFLGPNFFLYPAPITSDSSSLIISYAARPGILVTTGDPLEIPEHFYETLVRFCLMRAKELDSDWEAARIFQKSYEEELASIRTEINNVDSSAYPTVREVEDY